MRPTRNAKGFFPSRLRVTHERAEIILAACQAGTHATSLFHWVSSKRGKELSCSAVVEHNVRAEVMRHAANRYLSSASIRDVARFFRALVARIVLYHHIRLVVGRKERE